MSFIFICYTWLVELRYRTGILTASATWSTWSRVILLMMLGNVFQQDSLKGGKWSNGAEMTEEEALAEQQRMFAEARARMNGGAAPPKEPDSDQTLDS